MTRRTRRLRVDTRRRRDRGLLITAAAVTRVCIARDVAALISRPNRRQLAGKVAHSLAGALDPLRRQLTADVRDPGSTHLSVLIALQTFPVRSGAQIAPM